MHASAWLVQKAATATTVCLAVIAFSIHTLAAAPGIDRHALVTRHEPAVDRFDVESPFTVGNGEFAFTADATGLQTFPDAFTNTIPLGTLAQWGWHTVPNPEGWSIDRFQFTEFESHGRRVGYADIPGNKRTPEINWLRSNPHRLHLGRIGFALTRADGRPGTTNDLTGVHQRLALWEGVLKSHFLFEGQPVEVETVCHPTLDLVAVHVASPLLRSGRLVIDLRFPYGTGQATAADWTRPLAHETTLDQPRPGTARFTRRLDDDMYEVAARWTGSAQLEEIARHQYRLRGGARQDTLEFVAAFSRNNADGQTTDYTDYTENTETQAVGLHAANQESAHRRVTLKPLGQIQASGRSSVCSEYSVVALLHGYGFSPCGASNPLPGFAETKRSAGDHWTRFWNSGGAIDLSGSADPRWRELERRIVLSQYLTAIQCAGSFPPQETGLTYNSWEGKFHLEMHPWHAAHFALWGRLPLVERSLGFYGSILPKARTTARRQGYQGARWPKMTSPTGAESPSTVGPFLVWQQPHPILFAELCHRTQPNAATLERYRNVVFDTAEFMASFAAWDEHARRYVLGPPLQCAQEAFPKDRTMNPTFELTYWRWGLETAQRWRERLGLPRFAHWDRVLRHMASPPMDGDRYLFAETAADTYSARRWTDDHPSVTAAYGFLPGPGIDQAAMRRTLDWVWANWNWADTWGWDYPMVAMCAARVGEPERAVDALLMDTPKNRYRCNGHNHQRPGLTIYLPGNGGLLYAVAMMAAGWDGAPNRHAPGFPDDGSWTVRWEDLRVAP